MSELPAIAGVSLGGMFAGALGVAALRRLLRARVDCSGVSDEGGSVEGVRYLERIRGNADPRSPLPMIILFHSLAATPQGFASMLRGVGAARLILPEGPLEASSGRKWWRLGVHASVTGGHEAEAADEWRNVAHSIAAFIRAITVCRPTVGRPIVTGSSQGGEMALLMASEYPDLVASGVAVSSYLLRPLWTASMAPVAMIHGTGDSTVPYSWAKDYADQLSTQGAPLTFTSFPSSGHAVTKDMSNAWIRAVAHQVSLVA